ncbi:glycosyl transferases group 1 family protein [Collimonas arenae]|uniref:Glycosyl transferases group 1 family protein n=1 Tax=Collimonas arenae TaxID=279058 RepID=A0A127QN37_9BURK|nr:glycosyltransferase family 4 protein [Collimonas arenae]AMP01147.1 glycosyl transferases group 1 family protein [Collimonas arenae]AMP11042.1 glycosyl transferases group 1 family protein [Collimonas arenae]
MRVLHFYKTYQSESYGGIEQTIYQLCKCSPVSGIESEVLTLSESPDPAELLYEGHKVHRVKLDLQIASTGFSFSALKRFAQLVADADVVHYHFPWPFMDLAHFVTRMNKPSVVTYHSDIVRYKTLLQVYKPLMHRFLSSVDAIVATSPNYLQTSSVLAGYKDKTQVIPIGLDKNNYAAPSAAKMQEWKERIGDRFFLFVGAIRYYKGLHILLDAARGTNYPIVIVGAGPIEQELRQRVREQGLNNVIFLGIVDDEDKVALLQLCYALVFPSHLRSEAFGISLLEGAMYGKPMISSEIGTGTSYINNHGETGLVVPPSDSDAFRAAMRQLWDDPVLAATMGTRAHARYQKLFTARVMGESYARLYRDVLDMHGLMTRQVSLGTE